MKIKYFIILITTGTFSLFATEASPRLDDYVQQALKSNTQILSSQLADQAAEYDASINSALPDPVFLIEGRGIPMNLSKFGETRELMFMLEQMFPPAGALKRQKRKGEFASDIQSEMLRAVENEVRQNIKRTYFQLSFLDAALATNSEHQRLLDQLESIVRSRYIVAKAGQQDLFQVKIEKAQLQTEQLTLQQRRASLAVEFNQLLNRELRTVVETESINIQPTLLDTATLKSALQKWNPFLNAAKIRIESRKNDIQLARAAKRPSVKVMGGYMAMNSADDVLMGSVGLTLPFMPWASKDTRAALEKSQVQKNKSDADYATLRDQLFVKMIDAENKLSALRDQIKLYKTQIVPAAEETVSLSIVGYQTDAVDFLSLVQYTRESLTHKLRLEQLKSELVQQLAVLENILGTSLDEVIK